MTEAMNLGLAALAIVMATWAVTTRDTFAAVVGFVVYGLLLALVWVQLGGIDVALTEAALGSGLTGALLLAAATRLRRTDTAGTHPSPTLEGRCLAALFSALLAAALAIAVLALPERAPTLAPQVAANMKDLGVGNPITAVLLAFRALDTLLEATVVLFALVGVWSLAADAAWGGQPGAQRTFDATSPLTLLARLLPPVGIIVAVYIFWIGADLPGGKFQGATLLAAMWLLPIYAGIIDTPAISRRALRLVLVLGPLAFVGVGAVGIFTAGAFLAYPAGWEKALILLVEWALFPSLALTLALIVAGPPECRPPVRQPPARRPPEPADT